MTVKAYGNQWYWSYEYPEDQGGGFKFDSYMLREGRGEGEPARSARR